MSVAGLVGGGVGGGGRHGDRQTMGQIWEGPDPLPGPMARMQQWGPEEGFLSFKWGPGSERTAGWAGAWGAQGVTTPSRLRAPWRPQHSQAGPPRTAQV